jgi:hypothetical protein
MLDYRYVVLFILASGFTCVKYFSRSQTETVVAPDLLVQLNETTETFYHKSGECIICIEDYGEDEIRMLPCLHTFHKKCIDCWFTTSQRMECPICSQPLV